MAVALPFMLWAYFAVFVHTWLILFDRDVTLPQVANRFSFAFLLAAGGKLLEVQSAYGGYTALARWPYIVLSVAGLGLASHSIHRDLEVPLEDSSLAVVAALLALQLLFYFVNLT